MRLLTWNLEWKNPRKDHPATHSIRARLEEIAADVVCLTETHGGWLEGGHEATAAAATGSPRRKVILWSRWPLRDIDAIGPAEVADLHRWCAATTDSPIGPLRLIGVVIPYRGSNVSSGTGAARDWEDHERYLEALARVLEVRDRGIPTVVMGDYNQRLDGGGSSIPVHLRDCLRELLAEFALPTRHLTSERRYLIDHIAVDGLEPATSALIESEQNGVRRSVHHGAWIDVS